MRFLEPTNCANTRPPQYSSIHHRVHNDPDLTKSGVNPEPKESLIGPRGTVKTAPLAPGDPSAPLENCASSRKLRLAKQPTPLTPPDGHTDMSFSGTQHSSTHEAQGFRKLKNSGHTNHARGAAPQGPRNPAFPTRAAPRPTQTDPGTPPGELLKRRPGTRQGNQPAAGTRQVTRETSRSSANQHSWLAAHFATGVQPRPAFPSPCFNSKLEQSSEIQRN